VCSTPTPAYSSQQGRWGAPHGQRESCEWGCVVAAAHMPECGPAVLGITATAVATRKRRINLSQLWMQGGLLV
jgi:hypothetical protein